MITGHLKPASPQQDFDHQVIRAKPSPVAVFVWSGQLQ